MQGSALGMASMLKLPNVNLMGGLPAAGGPGRHRGRGGTTEQDQQVAEAGAAALQMR